MGQTIWGFSVSRKCNANLKRHGIREDCFPFTALVVVGLVKAGTSTIRKRGWSSLRQPYLSYCSISRSYNRHLSCREEARVPFEPNYFLGKASSRLGADFEGLGCRGGQPTS